MERTIAATELIGQSLRFRQGARVLVNGRWYQMDGTDGQARLMLLPTAVYRALRGKNASLTEEEIGGAYLYVTGIPVNIIEGKAQ